VQNCSKTRFRNAVEHGDVDVTVMVSMLDTGTDPQTMA
jgi:hypothetical protein